MRNVVFAAAMLMLSAIVYLSYEEYKKSNKVVTIETNAIETNTSAEKVVVEISGAVNKPGVYEMHDGARIGELVETAGGLSQNVDIKWVSKSLNLAEKLVDSEKVYIPFEWDDVESAPSVTPLALDDAGGGRLINLNTASINDIKSLSGIGDVYARLIIENRPYDDLEDFRQRAKIPKATVDKISAYVTF